MPSFLEFAAVSPNDSWPVWLVKRHLYGRDGHEIAGKVQRHLHRILISRHSPDRERTIAAAVVLAQAALAGVCLGG